MSHQINAGDRRAVSSGPADRKIWPVYAEDVTNVWPADGRGPVSTVESLGGELLALTLNNLSLW